MTMTDKEKEEYPISPMHRHLKQVVWYQLAREPTGNVMGNQETGPVHRMKWLFQSKDFPCGACHRSDHVKFMVLPTGVYRSCENEGFTEKVEPIDEGEMHSEAILLEDLVLKTNQEAIDVIRRYKQEKIYLNEDSHIFLPQYKMPKFAGRKPD
jgi:hypothetical protein